MRKLLCCSLLVISCQLFISSCKQTTTPSVSSATIQQRNTTLEAIETPAAIPVMNTASSKQSTVSIDKMLSHWAPEPQIFNAKASDQIILNCDHGSVLKFSPDIFVYADSKLPVEGPVDIAVTEYLDDAAILLKGLTTMCGKEMIETAGMLFIEVTAGGKPCEIKEGEYFEIEIPAETEKENMELFLGDELNGQINWYSANRGRLLSWQDGNTASWYRYASAISNNGQPAYEGGFEAMYQYLKTRVHFPDWTGNIELKGRCYVNFMLDYEGEVKRAFSSPYIRTYADQEILEAFKEMPCWQVPGSMGKGDAKRVMIPVNLEWVKDPAKIPVKVKIETRPVEKRFDATFVTDKYLMASSQLGWINCDRFLDNKKPKTELFVELDSTYDATVRIVFTDYKSVMGGVRYTKGFVFDKVPVGEKITVIAVRNNNGNFELSMKDCVFTGLPVKDLQFEKVDKDMMIYQFDQLGKRKSGEFASIENSFLNGDENSSLE